MSKGTILYVGGFELPDKNAAAHRVLNNGKIFRELGYNVVFVDVDKSLQYDSDILTTKKVVQEFECWSVAYPKRTCEWISYLSSINYLSQIDKNYKDIKLIIAYNYPSIALYNLKKYGNRNDIKVMADCTEWYSTKGSNIVFKVVKGLDSFYRMRVIQKKLDGLIVISKYLENYYRDSRNVVRIPPLVDINEEKWTTGKKKLKDRSGDWLSLVYSGSPGKNKDKIVNIIDALYALRELNKYQMSIIGLSKDEFIEAYPNHKKKIDELGKRVSFVGRVSHEDSIKELKNADYSIFIRDKSRVTMAGFPTKFVESITCSTPVITSDSSDIKEYFYDESNGFLIKDSTVKELIKSLRLIFEKESHARRTYNKINNEVFHYTQYKEVVEVVLERLLNIQ